MGWFDDANSDLSGAMNPGRDIGTLVRLFQDRHGLVLAAARRFSPTPELAYDIVQQVFLEFVQTGMRRGWDLEREIDPLLYGITKNVAMKCWRQERRQQPDAIRRLGERFLRAGGSGSADPRGASEIDALFDCLKKLTFKSRRLIEQYYFEDVPMEEICRQYQSKPNAIHQAFCRIRARLRECIRKATGAE